MTTMKDLYLNGVLVGQVPATGDTATDVAAVEAFLKAKGLHREVTMVQAMFRQAASFSDTAAMLFTDLNRTPSRGLTISPFVVNLTLSIELYLKTLAQIHGATLKGHDLAELYGALPAPALAALQAAIAKTPPCAEPTTIEASLRDLAGIFVQWRYVYESTCGPEVRIQPAIWTAGVLHQACIDSGLT